MTLFFVVLITALWLHHKMNTPSNNLAHNSSENEATLERTNALSRSVSRLQAPETFPPGPSIPAETDPDSAQEKYEAYVNERIAQLADLGMENDPGSLEAILSELNNREAAIRAAALDAAIQFGSRDAIPAMQNAMLQADDPEEKAALAKGIRFLQLTNFTETINGLLF